jgi:hypothetical protein
VDMRLNLATPEEKTGEAARAFALALPEPEVPFGEGPEFTVERAAQVAADLAPLSGLSMRQIKRVLLRVELAVRAYQGTPVDVPLLVFWHFEAMPVGQRLRRDTFCDPSLRRISLPDGRVPRLASYAKRCVFREK